MNDFFVGNMVKQLAVFTAAIHTYEIAETLTYAKRVKYWTRIKNKQRS